MSMTLRLPHPHYSRLVLAVCAVAVSRLFGVRRALVLESAGTEYPKLRGIAEEEAASER